MKSANVRSIAVLPLLLLSAAACGNSTGPGLPGVDITPSRNVFPIERENGTTRVAITGVIRNEGDRTVYYQYCGESIAKRTDGRWMTVWSPVCPAIYVPPAPIEPGASREFRIEIVDSSSLPIAFPLNRNGLYRIEIGLLSRVGPRGSEEFEHVRPSASVSRTFRVSE